MSDIRLIYEVISPIFIKGYSNAIARQQKMIERMTRSKKEKISKSKIKSYHFLPRKYGKDLLLDIARIETLKNFVLDSTPHQISFYEILFIEDGKGSFSLDEN